MKLKKRILDFFCTALLAFMPAHDVCASGFTFSELVDLIKETHPKTISELLQHLPDCMKSDYNVVYASRSAQFASPEFPRIILTCYLPGMGDPDPSDFVMSFSGDKTRFGYDKIEAIQFSNEDKSFHFNAIVFPKETKEIKDRPQIISYQKKDTLTPEGVYLGSEPSNCVMCHHGKPNWDLYYMWPGVLGSFNDNYYGVPSKLEQRANDLFINKMGRVDRYASLKRLNVITHDDGSHSVSTSPLSLTELLTDLNAQRIGRLVMDALSKSSNAKFIFAVAASQNPKCFNQNESIEDFIPPTTPKPVGYLSFQRLLRDTENQQAEYTVDRFKRINPGKDWLELQRNDDRIPKENYIPKAEESYFVATFRYVAQFIGIKDMRFWSLSLEPDTFAFSSGQVIGGLIPSPQALPFFGVISELRANSKVSDHCDTLKRESIKALTSGAL